MATFEYKGCIMKNIWDDKARNVMPILFGEVFCDWAFWFFRIPNPLLASKKKKKGKILNKLKFSVTNARFVLLFRLLRVMGIVRQKILFTIWNSNIKSVNLSIGGVSTDTTIILRQAYCVILW